jgi:hypothetical protein
MPGSGGGTSHVRPAAQLPMRLHAPPQLEPALRLEGTSPGGQAMPGPPARKLGRTKRLGSQP